MSKKILVIEDEPDVIKMVTFILRKKGYDVHEATDGKQGLELTQQIKPDLIMLDLFLPVMDGREVSKHLKSDDSLKDIPVLLVTASADNIAQKARQCEVSDYLLKPFDYKELLQKVEALLQQPEQEKGE